MCVASISCDSVLGTEHTGAVILAGFTINIPPQQADLVGNM